MEIKFMKEALNLAQEALECGEVPVGCVFVKNGQIEVGDRNRTNETLNGTAHAEILCIKTLENRIDEFKEMELYVTVEPCIMCAAALREIGIKHVYFGAYNDRFGGNGTVMNIHTDSSPYPTYKVTGGIMAAEAVKILRQFYARENEHAPIPKKKTNRVVKM